MFNRIQSERLRLLLLAGVLAPAVMVLLGFGLAYGLRREIIDLAYWPSPRTLATAAVTAAVSMGLVYLLSKSHPVFEKALKDTGVKTAEDALKTAGYPVMFVVVTAAGFAEEVLFRGGLQPTVGVAAAAVLFGFSHGGWRREMWAYVVAASMSGGLFGLVYHWTGDLWVPILAHMAHNIISAFLIEKVTEEEEPAPAPAPVVPSEPVLEAEALEMTAWPSPYPPRPTARQLGLTIGRMPTGPQNDLCDVPGVKVGHATVVSGDGALVPGQGPVRTGVTAILPHGGNPFTEKAPAGLFVLNGFGKSVGLAQVQELGTLETPILLTNTLSAFGVADHLVSYMIERNPEIGISTSTVNPVVGECNDGYLNDIQGRHVTREHVLAALDSAISGPVAQGAVGAGTGTVCFGFKGGIGSASRTVGGYTLGVLVQSNFGRREDLLVAGVPVGVDLVDYSGEEGPEPDNIPPGSIMVVIATDAPLDARQLTRLSKRGALGLARVGGSASNGSGDFVISFSTAYTVPHTAPSELASVELLRDDSGTMSRLFHAAVEAVEEAVLNSLFAATTVAGRDGHTAYGLPVQTIIR